MNKRLEFRRGVRALICALIASTTLVCTLSPSGWAMLVPAQGAAAPEGQKYDRAADMKTVSTALESKVVRERLKALGLTDHEIDSRMSRLSDQQIHQLAKDIHTLSPGGDLTGILLIVLLVLLIIAAIHWI